MSRGDIPFAFAISLKSKNSSQLWRRVEQNLSVTLKSILRQSEGNYSVYICGHDRPDIPELKENNVFWIDCTTPEPRNNTQNSLDKLNKRTQIGVTLRERGFSGYFCPVDADDILVQDFISTIRTKTVSKNVFFSSGYVVDYRNSQFYLRDPEQFRSDDPFFEGCGTSSAFYLNSDDFPKDLSRKARNRSRFIVTLTSHVTTYYVINFSGGDVHLLKKPLSAWILNHGENDSIITGKKKETDVGKRRDMSPVDDNFLKQFGLNHEEFYSFLSDS